MTPSCRRLTPGFRRGKEPERGTSGGCFPSPANPCWALRPSALDRDVPPGATPPGQAILPNPPVGSPRASDALAHSWPWVVPGRLAGPRPHAAAPLGGPLALPVLRPPCGGLATCSQPLGTPPACGPPRRPLTCAPRRDFAVRAARPDPRERWRVDGWRVTPHRWTTGAALHHVLACSHPPVRGVWVHGNVGPGQRRPAPVRTSSAPAHLRPRPPPGGG
jgi:hypothetical protein